VTAPDKDRPAFPHSMTQYTQRPEGLEVSNYEVFAGMSLRQWYAGMALQGMLANPLTLEKVISATTNTKDLCDMFSSQAFKQADSMLSHKENDGK
jgi:hypothetical protein